MSQIRREVLNVFKKLHRTRRSVFRGDEFALAKGREQINENFRKNRAVTDAKEIEVMIKLACDVEKELRSNVIQAVKNQKGNFELRITEETTRLDNILFNPNADIRGPRPRESRKSSKTEACSDGATSFTTSKEAKEQHKIE